MEQQCLIHLVTIMVARLSRVLDEKERRESCYYR
jgi:hypothetical protein